MHEQDHGGDGRSPFKVLVSGPGQRKESIETSHVNSSLVTGFVIPEKWSDNASFEICGRIVEKGVMAANNAKVCTAG